MVTVWDKRNQKWVNVPESWVDAPDFNDNFSMEKDKVAPPDEPVEIEAEGKPAAVKKPARATTKKEG